MAGGFNIVIAALVLSITAVGISFVVYVWARPRLTLEVAHAEVVSVRVSEELRGGPLTVTMTNLDVVVRNTGHRTALVDDWTIVRHLGTEREHLWDVARRDDLPHRFEIQAGTTMRWSAALYSPLVVSVSAEEAWSDVDILVTYRPFFFRRPRTVSKHFALAP